MSDKSKYRKEITEGFMYPELVGSGYDHDESWLIPLDVVEGVLDEIEYDVNNIKDMLSKIYGLTEIYDIQEKVEELSRKLY